MSSRYGLHRIALGGCLALLCGALLTQAAVAQGLGQANPPNGPRQGPSSEQAASQPIAAPGNPPAAANQTDASGDQEASKRSISSRIWRWTFRLGRDPIAVLTLALFVIGGLQVEISRRTGRRQLRAYMFVDHIAMGDGTHFKPHPPNVGVPRSFTIIKNFGQTPAYDVRHWGEIAIRRLTEEAALTVPANFGEKASISAIPPTGMNTKFLIFDRQPTPSEISEFQTRVSAVYVYGRIEYRDVFRRKRFTNYRLRYEGAWPPAENSTLTFCEQGNDAS